jgi:predicted DNA-binding protein (MmcQ/YjbR family)
VPWAPVSRRHVFRRPAARVLHDIPQASRIEGLTPGADAACSGDCLECPMTAQLDTTTAFDRVSSLCLALPEAERQLQGRHADFRVRNRPFAYFLDDHHGDGIVSVCCRCEPGENVDRAGRDPARFYLPAYIGKRGWFGIRLDVQHVDWDDVRNAIALSWRLAAPGALVARHETQAIDGVPAFGRRPDPR